MKQITVRTKPSPYRIYVGSGLDIKNIIKEINRRSALGNKAVLITNPTLKRLHKNILDRFMLLKPEVIILPDSERIKSFKYCTKLINSIAAFSYQSKVFLIGWGGGVIGDLTGFTASIYKRGIPYIQIPTTLLAQVDASIGGKTALDIKRGKNLVGTFWQPKGVISDISFLDTLKEEQIKEGLSEILKYALISQKSLLSYLEENHNRIFAKDKKVLFQIVYRCAAIKAEIVGKDEKEKRGIRTILNFGHTFAHALEAASRYQISHGTAVALGITAALKLSEIETGLSPQLRLQTGRLMEKLKLPRKLDRENSFWKKVEEYIKFDKKFIHRTTRFVLLQSLAKPVIKENIKTAAIRKSLKSIRA